MDFPAFWEFLEFPALGKLQKIEEFPKAGNPELLDTCKFTVHV